MPSARANCNFHSLGGVSPHENREERYFAYRQAWAGNPLTHTTGKFPLHLDIESTSRCNLRCTFCDKRAPGSSTFTEGDMDLGLYREILGEAKRHGLSGLKLSYRGEPLLHPQIVEMVALAKSHGLLDVYFNTNGMLLDANMAEALMEAGLDRISVSVEGTDKAAFEKARRGADFDRIKTNIAAFKRLRDGKGLVRPFLRVQTVRLPKLDLDAYSAYWLPLCDEAAAVDFMDVTRQPPAPVESAWACPQLWQRLTVDWQGNIRPCNNADQRAQPLGHAPEMSIDQAWLHPRMELARSLHACGLSHRVAQCGACLWRTSQLAKKDGQ